MHSPPGLEPVSPSPSTPSSGTPPPETDALIDANDDILISNIPTVPSSGSTAAGSGSGTRDSSTLGPKRPLPASSGFGGNSKSKRKMDHHHLRSLGGGFGGFGGGFGRRREMWADRDRDYGLGMSGLGMRESGRKEELIDVTYTEKLKKFIGDPFNEVTLQRAATEQ